MNRTPLFVSNEQVESILDWEKLISAVQSALKRVDSTQPRDDVIMPVRTRLTVPTKGFLMSMPCYLAEENIYCIKILTASYNNKALNLPSHQAMIELFNGTTGQHLATFAGEVITAQRTAAASAVATKVLVNGTPKVLAILGAGTQARSHFEVFYYLYPDCEIRVWNVREETGKQFINFISEAAICQGNNVKVCWCATVAEAVRDADIICSVTDASEPILKAEWVKPGAHINGVGACVPTKREIHEDLMNIATVYVDSETAAKTESGDIIQSRAKIFAEIGQVLTGKKEALNRTTTVFKSLGIAIEDAVTANLVYRALETSNKQNE